MASARGLGYAWGHNRGTMIYKFKSRATADDSTQSVPVSLRQRLWPMIDMLRRAHQADEPVVWGV